MRLLETIQVSPQTIGGGTLSVPVTREADPQRTVRAARVYSSLCPPSYAALRMAPSGNTPAVAHRHRAISNLRASATMPTLRVRLPVPNRA